MDVHYELNGAQFVWNADKARRNSRKHDGISFEQAAEAFFDPFLKVVDATREGEARDAVIGTDTRGRLLFVVHLEFEGEHIRIISARKATKEERATYDD